MKLTKKMSVIIFLFTLSIASFVYAHCCPGDCCISPAAQDAKLFLNKASFAQISRVIEAQLKKSKSDEQKPQQNDKA